MQIHTPVLRPSHGLPMLPMKFGEGLGDVYGNPDPSTTQAILAAVTAGSMAANRTIQYGGGGYGSGGCPIGTVFNPDFGGCQPGGSLAFSGSSGGVILLAIGAVVLFFMMRR